jgi:hypothetical protein
MKHLLATMAILLTVVSTSRHAASDPLPAWRDTAVSIKRDWARVFPAGP